MLFSIIVPVFNAGGYLPPAIESILQQSYKDFELLLIDDGSSDGSGEKCEKYAKLDSRVRTFSQQNAGICKTRNFGLDNAQGEYVMFCDHDDEYLPGYLNAIASEIAVHDPAPDIVKANFRLADRWTDGRIVETHSGWQRASSKWSRNSEYDFFNLLTLAVWDGAYRRDFLSANELRFNEHFLFGSEDFDFTIKALSKTEQVYWINNLCYCHYANFGTSISTTHHPERIENILETAHLEMDLFPTEDRHVMLSRYRRWNSVLIASIIRPAGKSLTFAQRLSLMSRFKREILPVAPNPLTRGFSAEERILAAFFKLRLFWLYSATTMAKLYAH